MKKINKKTIIFFMLVALTVSNISSTTFMAFAADDSDIVIYAHDYGVDPTGKNDNAKALVKVFEAVKELGKQGKNVTLKFDNGIYQVHKENSQIREIHTSNTDSVRFPNKSIGILIEGQKNLTIDGGGAKFIINGDMMALAVLQSENITIKNISIDYQIPTTSEMTVLDYDMDNKTVDYFIPEYLNYEIQGANILWKSEQKSNGEYYWQERNDHRNYGISVKYPTELMGRSYYSHQNPFTNAKSIEKLDNSRVRIKYNSNPAFDLVKGMNFQLVSNAERPTAGAFVWESKDVNIINTKISYMHGFGFLVQMAENVTFDGIRMETDIETGRNTSSFADGIHVSGAKGKIEIKNSFFNNTHDDPINIHGTFTRVEEIIGSHKLKLKYVHAQQGGFKQYYKGDKVVFYTRDTLESRDNEKEYTVKSVEGPTSDNLKEMIVEFEEEVPSFLNERIGNEPKFVAENSTYTPEILIKNNEFKNVFTRMILATSRKKVVIEDNYFESPSMPTMFFSNDSDEWYESGPIRDLEIRNNTFNIRTLGRTWWKYAPGIYVHPVTKGGGLPDESNPIHKNILIEDNTFYLESDGAVRAESVENLTFRNNKVFRLDPGVELNIEGKTELQVGNQSNLKLTYDGNVVEGPKTLPGGPEGNSGSVANVLEFKNSKNVVLENNFYDDGLKQNVLLEGMSTDNLKMTDNLKVLTKRENTKPSEAVSDIQYASTNPEVLSVDKNGKMTAHKEGSVEVFAYYIWNDTIIESNKQEIKVSKASDIPVIDFEFESDVMSINDESGVSFKVKGDINADEIEYVIHDEDIIRFDNNKFYGLKSGLARITAKYEGVEKNLFMVVNKNDDQKVLNPIIKIEDKDNHSVISEDSINITRQSGNDLWGNDNTLSNLVTINLDSADKNNFTGIVTIDGLPERASSNWDSAYFLIMKEKADGTVDRNNYLSIGKRAHADGIGTVHEVNARGSEYSTNNTSENSVRKATFAIEKQGTLVNLYSIIDGVKNKVQTVDIKNFGDNLKLAIAGWGNAQANKDLKITDIKIGNGTVDDVMGIKSLPIMILDRSEFTISNLSHEVINHESINMTFDSNYEGKNFVIVNGNGNTHLIEGTKVMLSQDGDYKIYVVSQLPSGKFSNILDTTISHKAQELEGVYINGKKVVDGDTITIPSMITKLHVKDYDNKTEEVVDIKNKDILNGKFGSIKLNKIKSSATGIKSINTKGFGKINLDDKNSFINTDKKDSTITFEVELTEGTNKLIAKNHDHGIKYEVNQVDNKATVTAPVYNGVNSIAFEAIAHDGITKTKHTVHVMRYAPIEKGIKSIVLNNNSVDLESDKIDLENKTNKVVIDAKANDKNANVSVMKRSGVKVETLKGTDTIEVENGDEIVIRIIHENGRSLEFKTFTIENAKEQIDIRDLTALIEKAENINLENITDETKEVFISVLKEVQEGVGNGINSEAERDSMIKKLQEAINQLKEKPTNPNDPDEDKPTDPDKPDEDKPTDPDKPDEDKPTDPDKPDEDKPTDPDKPNEDKPTDTDKPDNEKPADPDKQQNPSNSNKPNENKDDFPETGMSGTLVKVGALIALIGFGLIFLYSKKRQD
ncbi:Ig-like domain-containing protein [Clostridium sardiniense]|uniref:Ig-like domain-containing protein n=1 Tax=Clostridium sardiniense TaxID=29369 RepID=A0ABS7KX20_CLOSR|nr:Ig-like domain-containing protein [Clostridium sardiniense]MBY0755330.1 Ig-like domain-containing protein [Clostridium sardiniense]MDQ0459775.1 hypothetical protein [Clostridium sardiniense]